MTQPDPAASEPPQHRPSREMDERFAVEPPRMTVLSDHPILRDDDDPELRELDYFGLRSRLASVYDIIRHRNTRTPMAVALYGDWGTGKSSAMRWLSDQLALWSKQSKDARKGHKRARTVWFEPWKYQTREDVWRGLIAEVILSSIDVHKASLATVTNAAKKFGLFLGRGFLNVLSSAKLKAGAKPIGGEVEVNLDVLRKIADDYHQTAHPEKAYLNEFETTLKQWVRESLGKEERMVLFIDDLDRCLPEVTFEVLEALKLYLNIPELIFVIGLDRRVVDLYVRKHYKTVMGDDVGDRQHHYLDKMFQVEIDIPPSQRQIKGYLDAQIDALDRACDGYWSTTLDGAWNGQYRGVVERSVRDLAEHNPREIKRLLNSTLLRATAAARNEQLGGTEDERFAQGAQVFLIQRILRHRVPDSSGMMLEEATLAFFEQWSRFVRDYPKFRIRSEKRLPDEEVELHKLPDEADEPSDPKAQAAYDRLRIEQPRYRDTGEVYPLLQNSDFFHDLLTIPFSNTVAAATAIDRKGMEQGRGGVSEFAAATATAGVKDALPGRPEGPSLSSIPRALLSAIAESLEKPVDQLVADDLFAVHRINLSGSEIADLSPLEHLLNLEWLYIVGTQVSNLSPLERLSNLQSLYIDVTEVSDLSPLKNLLNLQNLYIGRTPVSDLSPLEGLSDLQSLYISGTRVSDLSPLEKLSNLQLLNISGTPVSDLLPLEKLPNLQLLKIVRTQVSDEHVRQLKQKLSNLKIIGP